jgi:hypothetical protein
MDLGKTIETYTFCLLTALHVMSGGPTCARAQDFLTEPRQFVQHYQLTLTGTVLQEKFSGVQALLTLTTPLSNSINPYLIIVEAFPTGNARNSFHWWSEDCRMMDFLNEISCKIKGTVIKPRQSYFTYMSPYWLRGGMLAGVREQKRMQEEDPGVLPIMVPVEAGELTLKLSSGKAAGEVWMRGYDSYERTQVLYRATFEGRKAQVPKRWQQFKK